MLKVTPFAFDIFVNPTGMNHVKEEASRLEEFRDVDVHDGLQHGRRETRAGRKRSGSADGDRSAAEGARAAGQFAEGDRAADVQSAIA